MLHVPGMPEGVHVSFSPEQVSTLALSQPDPVLALIEAHRAAYAAWEPLGAAWNDALGGTPEYAAAEAAQAEPYRREREAFGALLATRPTTAGGLWALTTYIPEFLHEAGFSDASHEQATLDALREGALQLGLASVVSEAVKVRPEGSTAVDTSLIQWVRELAAIEAEQTAILKSGTYADAYDSPDWVRLEGHRETILERVIATRAHTMDGLKAKASLLDLESVKHFQKPTERLADSMATDIAAMPVGAPKTSEALAALIKAHELAYGHALFADTYGEPDAAARRQAKEEAFRALLHTPLHSDADRAAYALAVIERQSSALVVDRSLGRDHPMPVAYRNLRLGEYAREPVEMRDIGRAAEPETPEDPHVALLPALRQAFAWNCAAMPIRNDALSGSREDEACGAVHEHCWRLAGRIVALPAPKTPAGLGALALALSVAAEGAIGVERGDDLDHERYGDEKRMAAAIRAMMAATGVEPLPGWTGFGDEPDHEARTNAAAAAAGSGSLPAWALAGEAGPDAEDVIGEGSPEVAPCAQAPAASLPSHDLSGYSIPQLCALFGVYERAEDHFYSAAWWPKLGEAGSSMVTSEGDRCMALKDAVADELQKRTPVHGTDADDRGEMLMRRTLVRGNWDATAQLVSCLRGEVSVLQGAH
ncbi:hypothetical protein SAMN04487843_108233 [Methylobacterium sp. ap11]|uniref:hypothetical protein n=1 Tax=Methylobacterium sp. ap11 TaxID=1761799 RepID=UPI0008C6EAE9|nr:hypothetical protein [Methylobacterium sp. ap11]SEP21748.1 hypothetical protein SAMN04487843_108233 [Methylobacterium sp. ap11]